MRKLLCANEQIYRAMVNPRSYTLGMMATRVVYNRLHDFCNSCVIFAYSNKHSGFYMSGLDRSGDYPTVSCSVVNAYLDIDCCCTLSHLHSSMFVHTRFIYYNIYGDTQCMVTRITPCMLDLFENTMRNHIAMTQHISHIHLLMSGVVGDAIFVIVKWLRHIRQMNL